MGIMDFVKGGVREMMIARPDNVKHLIVYKHPDQNVPMYSQLTVDSDECALFFKDGKYMGFLPARPAHAPDPEHPVPQQPRHPVHGRQRLHRRDLLREDAAGPRRALRRPARVDAGPAPRASSSRRASSASSRIAVVDPVRFVVGYYGQAAGSMDNDQTLDWIKGKFFMSVKAVIGQRLRARSRRACSNLGGMTLDIAAGHRRARAEPRRDRRPHHRARQLQHQLQRRGPASSSARRTRSAARPGAASRIAEDAAAAKQFELDQKFGQDARYVQQLAGNWNNYAAGSAMMGAGRAWPRAAARAASRACSARRWPSGWG